jgi:Lrp/AsnC family leucine-responsive transcriptional regulator
MPNQIQRSNRSDKPETDVNTAKYELITMSSEKSMQKDSRFHALDRGDRAIIEALQENGRESFAEIGKNAGLSATTVAERIRRLESAGVIRGYHVSLSAASLGYPLMAFILARPVGPDARFAKLASEQKEIVECYRVTGDVSFIARAVVRDMTHLERLLNRLEPSSSYVVTLLVLSAAFERPARVGED